MRGETRGKSDISVVVPVRDRGELAVATLDSIAGQTLNPAAIIIVDNGSAAPTRAMLEAWVKDNPEAHAQLITEPRPGAAIARNTGLAHCQSEWTLFFDSDDIMRPMHLATAAQAASETPETDIVAWSKEIRLPGQQFGHVRSYIKDHPLYYNIMEGTLATANYMARTSLLREAGGWNDEARVWDDIELSTRLLARRPVITVARQIIPQALILQHGGSITGSDYSSRAVECDRTLDMIESSCGAIADGEFKHLRAILALKRAILAARCRREGRRDLASMLIAKTKGAGSKWQQLCVRWAYTYTSLGLRGAARILRPVFV